MNTVSGECIHEVDTESLVYDKKFGRIGKCKLCGCKLAYTREVHFDPARQPKEHMSKKERLRRKRNIEKAVAIARAGGE